MKFATLVFALLIFGAVGFCQEPENHAVSQPMAAQNNVTQPTAAPVPIFQSVSSDIPTVFVPLPTAQMPIQPTVLPRNSLLQRHATQADVVQPKVTSCACATH